MENQRMQKGNMAARNNRAMQSSEVFIRLDISMLNSYDMMLVREKYGIEGWGVVVFIMKYLIERRTDCRAPLYAVNEIARICHKRKNSVLQLIMEFPSLFEIEANGKIFFSPYLLQFFGNSSANEKQTNRSLDKLTNETLDNQEVSFPKNKNKEQEQLTTKEKKRKGTSPYPRGTSPAPSQGGERDADERILREKETSPTPLLSSSCKPNEQQTNDSQGGERDADERILREKRSTTPIYPATSCGMKQRKTQKTEVRHRTEQTADAPLPQAEMGVTRDLLTQLYQDNNYMTSLERIANLAVRTNFAVRRNLFLWFQHYCQSHAKRVKDVADAKDYLANLMRPGSNTRAQFMAYQNKLYSIEWAKKQALKERSRNCGGFVNASNSLSSKALLVSA